MLYLVLRTDGCVRFLVDVPEVKGEISSRAAGCSAVRLWPGLAVVADFAVYSVC